MSTPSQRGPKPMLIGHQRQTPLHALLGGGKIADVLLWTDTVTSAAVVAGFSIVWFLFQVVGFNLITLFCHALIALMLILFIWHNAAGAGLITWRIPNVHEIGIPESTIRYFHIKFTLFLRKFYAISTGQDLKLFFVIISSLVIVSIIGNYFTTVNLLYIMFLSLVTVPVMYERYEYEVGDLASKGNQDMRRLFSTLDSKFLNKIPTGPMAEPGNFFWEE